MGLITTHLTMFQLNSGGQFYLWRKPEYTGKTTVLPYVIDKLPHTMLYEKIYLTSAGFELTILLAIDPTTTQSRRPSVYVRGLDFVFVYIYMCVGYFSDVSFIKV